MENLPPEESPGNIHQRAVAGGDNVTRSIRGHFGAEKLQDLQGRGVAGLIEDVQNVYHLSNDRCS